jgi:RNA polymerase sigma-70 factor (ECF subfamily)
LDELPAEQRQAFVLHADGGMRYADIADVQQVAIGTVMSRIYYARHRLREMLADLAETYEAGARKDVQR